MKNVMIGIGCGQPEIHVPELPLETANYLLQAEYVRRKESPDIAGKLLLADKAVDDVRAGIRRQFVEQLLNRLQLHNHWTLILQSELHSHGGTHDIVLAHEVPAEKESYLIDEIRDAQLLLGDNGVKVGWVTAVSHGEFKGGEVFFDQHIAHNVPGATFAYCPSGMDLNGRVAAPYLAQDPGERLMLPDSVDGIEREVSKIQTGVRRSALGTVQTFIDQMNVFPDIPAPEPKLSRSKSVIRDEHEVRVLRDGLRLALARLLESHHYAEAPLAATIGHQNVPLSTSSL